MRQPGTWHAVLSLAVLSVGALLAFSPAGSDAGLGVRLFGLMALVLIYASAQLALVRRFHPIRWMANPAVQYALLGHLLPTFSLFALTVLPEELQRSVAFDPWPNVHKVTYQWLNLLGAVALWTGYWSGPAHWLARRINASSTLRRVLRPSLSINPWGLAALVILAYGGRGVAIHLGLFGYSASYERLMAAAAYTQYLAMAADMGKIVLVAAALSYFAGRGGGVRLVLLFGAEMAFGVLSGFKSAVIAPLIVVGIAYYLQRGVLPRWFAPSAVACILAAYALIEPFREVRNNDASFEGTSIVAIVDAFSAGRDRSGPESDIVQTAVNFLARAEDLSAATHGIEYAAQVDILPAGSPDFLADIFFSPIYSFVPRVLWQGKPTSDLGLWYTQVVMGRETLSSTGMYPVTYLNFAGGPIAVVLGFFVIGVLQAALFRSLIGIGGAAIFVLACLIGSLGHIDSVYYAFFISLARYLPLLLLVQRLLFRDAPRAGREV